MSEFNQAREKEIKYHTELYADTDLFQSDSWLSRPEKLVLDSLDRLDHDELQVLDLGCGVGRNSIPIARKIQPNQGKVHCIDLLPTAILRLEQYSEQYGVEDRITSQVMDVEDFRIRENTFDYIISSSCLEHVSSENAFLKKLHEMKAGTKAGGINCILINTDVKEVEVRTGDVQEGLIELNLSKEQALSYLREVYNDWEIYEEEVGPQETWEDQDGKAVLFKSNWITFAAQRR
jgi:cyclopropane fatty-acyl-phospholipid synthase-like methyltransferase